MNLGERTIRRAFRIGLWLKAANGAVEVLAGLAFLASADSILQLVRWLTRHELLEDPNDASANALLSAAERIAIDQKTAVAAYLLTHGVVKLFLVVMVLMERMWAYPVFIALLLSLILYQSYELTLQYSGWLVGLTVLDALVLVLTWHEFRLHRRSAETRN